MQITIILCTQYSIFNTLTWSFFVDPFCSFHVRYSHENLTIPWMKAHSSIIVRSWCSIIVAHIWWILLWRLPVWIKAGRWRWCAALVLEWYDYSFIHGIVNFSCEYLTWKEQKGSTKNDQVNVLNILCCAQLVICIIQRLILSD